VLGNDSRDVELGEDEFDIEDDEEFAMSASPVIEVALGPTSLV
jgi:hypothetical protein